MRQGITIVFLIALAWGGLVRAETATPELLFQKALHMETAKGDYRGAIPVYEEIINTQEANAQWAAKALYRMGLCWEKIGDQQKTAECARRIEDKYASVIPENADMQKFIRKYSKKGTADGIAIAQQYKEKLWQKLETIMITKLEFRDATIEDVVTYLHQQCVALDTNSPPGEKGVNILLRLSAPAGGSVPAITMTMRDISLMNAIKYIADITGLKFRVEERAVIIHSSDIAIGDLQTRTYKVLPPTIEVMTGGAEVTPTETKSDKMEIGQKTVVSTERTDIKKFLNDAGVPFPENTSVTYIPAPPMLIIKNTAENLESFERLLNKLNMPPMQVKVDVQLIEIAGEQTASMANKQNIARGDLEKIPTNQIRYLSRLTVVTKPGMNAEARNTRNLRHLSGIGSSGPVSSNQFSSETEYEIGATFNVTPTIGPDNETIELVFVWQSSELLGWTNVPGLTAPDPVIVTKAVNTGFTLWDQQSMVMQVQKESNSITGSGTDSKQYFLIVTAVLVDPAGNAIKIGIGGRAGEASRAGDKR